MESESRRRDSDARFSDRVRLPNVIVDRAYNWPPVLTAPPLIVIEVLSPYDSYAETQRLATDYQNMGIPNIWLIDPETKTGRVCEGPVWKEVKRFEVEGRGIYLELDWHLSGWNGTTRSSPQVHIRLLLADRPGAA